MQTTIQSNLKELANVVKKLIEIIKERGDDINIVFLKGDLSSGKTTFVQKYTSLFTDTKVTSPTFSVIHEYSSEIFHYDLYQKSWNELLSLGIIEFLTQKGIHFVEWSSIELEQTLQSLDITPINIEINNQNTNNRIYTISL
jgi:tRNA threonylcarbamoyladenosine biosynthesis protein TsaE